MTRPADDWAGASKPGYNWRETASVKAASAFPRLRWPGWSITTGSDLRRYNRVTFDPVETTGLRIEVELNPPWSGGILEWKVE